MRETLVEMISCFRELRGQRNIPRFFKIQTGKGIQRDFERETEAACCMCGLGPRPGGTRMSRTPRVQRMKSERRNDKNVNKGGIFLFCFRFYAFCANILGMRLNNGECVLDGSSGRRRC